MSIQSRSRTPDPVVTRAKIGVYVVFFVGGFIFANWASRMPAIRASLDVNPGQLGLVLLFASFGSILAMPLAGSLVMRFGVTSTLRVFVGVNLIGYVGAVLAVSIGSAPLTAAALFVTGLGMGPWDVTMNLAGTVVEQRLGKSIMPRFHALWSFGTVLGALTGAAAEWLHLTLVTHLVIVAALCMVAVWIATGWLLPVGSQAASSEPRAKGSAARAWLEPRTLIIGLIVLSAALAEGSANDWISLGIVEFLTQQPAGGAIGVDAFLEQLFTPAVLGAIGLGVFLTAMTTMRLAGTRLIDRYGRVAVLRICYSLAAVGLLVYVFAPWLWLAFVGVAIWGLGAAIGFPVGMSAASDEPLRAPARVSVVSTIGYTAFIAGPPLLGMLATHVGYRNAMLAVLVPAVIGLALSGIAAPPVARRESQGSGGT